MKKNNAVDKIALIETLIFICWCIVVMLFKFVDLFGFYSWSGFAFGAVAFFVTIFSLYNVKIKSNRNTTEINFIPVYITLVYYAIALVINSVFVFTIYGRIKAAVFAVNFIALIIFVVLRMFTDDYRARVEQQTEHFEEKVRPVADVSARLAVLLSSTSDKELHAMLLKLKEKVDYSNNVSQSFTVEFQNTFIQQLDEVKSLVAGDMKDEAIAKINEADKTWNMRNSLSATIK